MGYSFIYLFIALILIMFLIRLFLPLFVYLVPILVVIWVVKHRFDRKKKEKAESEQTYEYHQSTYDTSSDIIDVDYTVVDEQNND